MSDGRVYYGPAWGQVLSGDQQEGHLATLDAERAATPQRVEAARALFTEAAAGDFEPFGTTGRKFRHRETGREYVLAAEQVLMDRDPRKSGIEFFVIAGGQLLFLRERGWCGNLELGIPGQIVSGKLERSPSGGVQVRDVRSGSIVREGLRL